MLCRLLLVSLALLAGCAPAKRPPPPPEAASGVPSSATPDRPPAVYHSQAAGAVPSRTRTGRYFYVANGAEAAQVDPLLAIIEVRIPSTLTTVEEAVDYLLKRSGYCLMEPTAAEVRHLLHLPLPGVHRHPGPMTLREALLALGGQAFDLVVDEVYREVGYRVAPAGGAS